jgi:hypothetical protein
MPQAAQTKELVSASVRYSRLNTHSSSILCFFFKQKEKESKKDPSQGKKTQDLGRQIHVADSEISELGGHVKISSTTRRRAPTSGCVS